MRFHISHAQQQDNQPQDDAFDESRAVQLHDHAVKVAEVKTIARQLQDNMVEAIASRLEAISNNSKVPLFDIRKVSSKSRSSASSFGGKETAGGLRPPAFQSLKARKSCRAFFGGRLKDLIDCVYPYLPTRSSAHASLS